ncbi:MAG: hypothetical protein GX111_05320 [Clostridiales bacterium]|nr:hypothetical protein [Clostridiales bacterium]
MAAKGWNDEPLYAIEEYVVTKTSYKFNFELLYQDFVVWLLNQENLTLADFDNPDNENTVAEISHTVFIPDSKSTVIIEKEEAETGVVAIFNTSGNAPSQFEYVDILWEPAMSLETEVSQGDVLVFIATNAMETDRTVAARIRLKNADTGAAENSGNDILAEHVFVVNEYGSAKIWAVKLDAGFWTIEPDKVEDGRFNDEYTFTVKGEKISGEINEVKLEYDFGDGGMDAVGSVRASVAPGGTVEADLSYIYEIPDNMNTGKKYPIRSQ